MAFPTSNPFTGSPLIGAGPTAPTLSGNPMLNMLLPKILPHIMPPGSTMAGGFFGTQHIMDTNRALAFQGDLLAAGANARQQADEQLQAMYLGFKTMGSDKPLTEAQKTHYRSAVSGMGSQLAMMAPMLAPHVPGLMQFLDAADMSGVAATSNLMTGGRAQIDPITGNAGWSPETVGSYMSTFHDRYYNPEKGSGADPSLMQGYGVGQLSQFISVGQRAGITPGRALAKESVDRLRRGLSVDKSLTANEREQVGAEGIAILEKGVAGGGTKVDEAVRRLDATKMAKYGENMAGLQRALEDLFGPGKPAEEYINLSHALTQGGLSRMSLSKMEDVVRQMKATGGITGTSIQELANLQATAAGAAAGSGAGQELGVGGGMYAAASVQALEGRFAGSGVTKSQVAQQMATLYGKAAASQVGQQFSAVQRISGMVGFTAGTEAEALHNAIKTGQDTYTWRGEQKNAFMRDEAEWQRIMVGGTEGFSAGDIASMRTDRVANERFMTHKARIASQRAQYGVDIQQPLTNIIGAVTRKKGDTLTGLEEDIWATITGFKSDDTGEAANMVRLRDAVQKNLEAAGITDAKQQATHIVGRADRFATGRNYDSIINMGMLHGGGREDQERVIARADLRATLLTATSSIGRRTIVKNFVDKLKTAEPGEDITDLLKASSGIIDIKQVRDAFDEVRDDINSGDYTDVQKKTMLAELEVQREKAEVFNKAEIARRKKEEEEKLKDADEAKPPGEPGDDRVRPPGDPDDLAGRGRRLTVDGIVKMIWPDGLDLGDLLGELLP